MFHAPGNILLEQAVHPLSQIATIAGPVRALRAVADPAKEIAPGLDFHPGATVALDCQHMPAQLRFAVGESFPFWRVTAVCDDAIATADILGNHVEVHARTRWMEPADAFVSTQRRAFSLAWSGWRNAFAYGLSTLRLVGRNDPFFLSMKGSIAAFHGALGTGRRIETDGAFGTMLAEACEAIHDQAFAPRPAAPSLAASPAPRVAPPGQGASAEVAVLGGTGFIGTETVRRFVASGLRVRVMARSLRNLPAVFRDPMVELHRGDIRDAGAVARAIGDAPLVVNLAHGGGGENFEAVRAAMVGGAETVARACLAAKVRRLVHVGSIASLYLGPEAGVVTGATPSDPRAEERADYSRAKAICDEMLLTMHARQGLPVVILRPGLVVGEGTSPFHAGLGLFNNDQHCIGWNAGRNPLPFVLVDDVAQAILLAVRAQAIEGRCYNLVGDVRPDARGYIRDLAQALGRPLQFHAQSPMRLWLTDLGKWLIKRAGGRAAPLPSRREFVSRGLMAPFDCADARRDLGWSPVSDPAVFARGAIAVHVR
jgi:nucleoside-diphosphate-sugar epimerase